MQRCSGEASEHQCPVPNPQSLLLQANLRLFPRGQYRSTSTSAKLRRPTSTIPATIGTTTASTDSTTAKAACTVAITGVTTGERVPPDSTEEAPRVVTVASCVTPAAPPPASNPVAHVIIGCM